MSETPMKKQALLIGINEYQILPGLKYARQDAEAVADSLKQNYCFSDNEVMVLTDARPGLFKPTSRFIIQDHLDKLANQELDLFIFGFWGHGLFRNGKRYLCPLDVMANRAEHQGLPFDELQELLAKIHAKNTCLILDCCQTIHDRGEAETLTASDKESMENAARDIVFRRKQQIPDFQSNVAILNSCKEGQSAYEWDARQHGLFTAHLLDAMKKRSNSVMQIASYISSNIEKTALELGKEQTPFYKLEGDIVLPVETKSTPLVTGDVFISYRHCNADLVAPVEAELKRRGISYFIDRVGINYSMNYSTVIAQAIEACKVLLVVWTKEANDSSDMLQEIVTAKTFGKQVFPYKLGTFDIKKHYALCYQLSPLSRCEAVAPTPDSVTELVNRIQLLLDPSAPMPPTPIPQPNPEPLKKGASGSDSKMSEFLQKKKNQLESDALEALEIGNYEQAIIKLEFLLNLDPDSAVAKKLMALCKLALEKGNKPNNASSGLKAGDRKTVTVNGVEFAFRWCPRGTFTMGSPEDEEDRDDDETQHQVTLTKGFWMMETQVTQKQWKAIMGNNPSNFKGDDLPVEQVSWNDCQEFCRKCVQLGLPVQLPTEAQWEYACRAGSTTAYFWGNALKGDKANCDGNYPCGTTTKGKYLRKTTPVGSYDSNAWGLYDMHGNVWEWCADYWKEEYPSGSVTDPTGPSNGSYRVFRGGSWYNSARHCRSASRRSIEPDGRSDALGFRCVKGQ
ncbi:MAG: SUMF1/EgtB/PvdO family nonheme iron enzyme [Thermoguttaceae bacterium]|nr:SUMF1/EgtB/PvdO family nonheme iron enzyme [Thermoguttaceae bacterium]